MTSDPITQILMALLALIFGSILWVILYRNSMVVISITLVVFILRVIFNREIVVVQIGPYNIFLIDLISIFLITISIAQLFRSIRSPNKMTFGVLFFGILLLISWIRGIQLFGLEISTNELRVYLYFYAVLLYTVTLSYSQFFSKKILLLLGLTSIILILISFIRWILVAQGVTTNINWMAPNGKMLRVISVSATLLLLQTQICFYYAQNQLKWKPFFYLGILLVIVMVLILQHRTVWATLIVTFILIAGLRTKQYLWIALSFLFSIVIMVILFINNDFSSVNLTGTSFDMSSFSWRLQGWKALLAPGKFHTTLDYFIGQPFGTGYSRYLTSTEYATTVSPHNFYVQSLLNIGGLGVFLIFLLYGWLLKSLWNQKNEKISRCLFVLLSTQLIYYVTYSPNYEQGLILGLAIIFVQWKRSETNKLYIK